jgi:hypothetical protein
MCVHQTWKMLKWWKYKSASVKQTWSNIQKYVSKKELSVLDRVALYIFIQCTYNEIFECILSFEHATNTVKYLSMFYMFCSLTILSVYNWHLYKYRYYNDLKLILTNVWKMKDQIIYLFPENCTVLIKQEPC